MLPNNFWCGIDSGYFSVWAKEIEKILLDKKDSEFFKNLQKARTTREFIVEKAHGRSFEWKDKLVAISL
jgi:hypothetical protein